MPSPDTTEAVRDARREFEICNACRYCEGFCAVFPAVTRRRTFSDADIDHLANLCHACKGCFHACQYAPPHPFGVNLPRTLAVVRQESYARYAWPAPLARLHHASGRFTAILAAACVAVSLALTLGLNPAAASAQASFYAIAPWAVMAGSTGAAALFALVAVAIGARRYWKATGGPAGMGGLHDALTLRNLGGGHGGRDGCNDRDEGFSQARRRLHHLMAYGFALCFAATCVAFAYDHVLGWPAPYPLFSAPVLLGTAGGVGMVVGGAGLSWVKLSGDPAPLSRRTLGGDLALTTLLVGVAASGLALLALRETAAMGSALAVHLGLVVAFFLTAPYGRMVHGLYRTMALMRNAGEAPAPRREPRFAITRSPSHKD